MDFTLPELKELLISLEKSEETLVQETHEQQELSKSLNPGAVNSDMMAQVEIKKDRIRRLKRKISRRMEEITRKRMETKRNVTRIINNA